MNKSAIALAVAAALAASAAVQAETTLYGSARVSVDFQKADVLRFEEPGDVIDVFDDGVWDVVSNSSRLGVKGSEDLGQGLSAIYQYEFGVDTSEGGNLNSNRPRVLGLKGGFGTVSIGTQWTPYYNVAGITDVFNSGKTFGSQAYLGFFRLDNSLVYQTPDFGGFSGEVMLIMNGTSAGRVANLEDNVDAWNINAKYTTGPLFAGLTYVALEGSEAEGGDVDQWGLGLGYEAGAFAVGFTYENGDLTDFAITPEGSRDDVQNYYGTVSYAFGNNLIRAAYGYLDADDGTGEEVNNYALGFQHNFSKRTRLWVEYVGFNGDDFQLDEPETLDFSGDSDAISIGMRHDF